MNKPLLECRNLNVLLNAKIPLVRDVSFDLYEQERLLLL